MTRRRRAPRGRSSLSVFERLVRYGAAGVLATLLYAGAVLVLVEWVAVRPVPAAAVATGVVITTSYLVNRRWVFETDRSHRSSFARFVAASLLGIVLNTSLMYAAVYWLRWPYLAGVAIATLVVPPLNFTVNYLWAFRPTTTGS